MLNIEGNSSFMQRFKALAFRFIIVIIMQLMGITISHAFQISFAGFSIGMSKEKVCEMLKNNNEYIVKSSISNEMDYILAPFNDTLGKNNLSINNPRCRQYYLAGKPPKTETISDRMKEEIITDNIVDWKYYGYIPSNYIKSIQYGEWSLQQPYLRFDEDMKLIAISSSVQIQYLQFKTLLENMNSKYGKYKTAKNRIIFWESKGTVFTLLDINPYSNSEKDIYVELYSEDVRKSSQKIKMKYHEDFTKNFIEIDNNKIKVLGHSLGENKKVFIEKLKQKYGLYRVGSRYEDFPSGARFEPDLFDLYDTDSNHIYAIIQCPDALILKLRAEFYKDKVVSITIHDRVAGLGYPENNHYLISDLESIIELSSKKYKTLVTDKGRLLGTSHASTTYRTDLHKWGVFKDTMVIKWQNTTLSMGIFTVGSYSNVSLVDDSMIQIREKERYESVKKGIVGELKSLFKSIKDTTILEFKINAHNEYFERNYTSVNENLIDMNKWENARLSEDRSYDKISYQSNYDTINVREVQCIFVDHRVKSIAFDMFCREPWSANNSTLKIEFKEILIETISQYIGKPSFASYNQRESAYWILGENILELVTKSDKNYSNNTFVIFRQRHKNDKLFTNQKKYQLVE